MFRRLIRWHERLSAAPGAKAALRADPELLRSDTKFRCPWWASFPDFSHAYMQARGMLGRTCQSSVHRSEETRHDIG